MKTIAVDMDEVLADVSKKIQKVYSEKYEKSWNEADLRGKDMREVIPAERLTKYLQLLNEPGFFRDLELMEDADKVLKELNDRYEVYLVSAAMEFPHSLKDKYDWVMEKLPFISWRQIHLCGVKYIVQTDIMIDDRSRNFKYFKGRKLLYTAHHNLGEKHYERVNNWQEIAAKLL